VRSVLLRGLGAVYLAAFVSLGVQVEGLIGSHGILPAAEYLDHVRPFLRASRIRLLPTLLWLDASDRSLHALCWGGAALSAALIAGVLPGVCLTLLWLFYLSLVVVGQEFLGYQWDALLLEAGLLGILFAPWGLWLGRARQEPSRAVLWLFRWLVFRLMFLSGLVKLTSGDPTWRAWQALQYHYETQPLPTWTSWYAHQCPPWFLEASVGVMFFAELVAPLFMCGPRVCRWVAFASAVGLQLLILATGNYGFFNLLSIVLCVALLDDRDLRANPPAEEAPARLPRKIFVAVVATTILLVTSMQVLEALSPAAPFPGELEMLRAWLMPFRSMNSYGLFAVMTTERPEITVEGSDDGEVWKPYRFRWKPGELDRRPRFTTPHMPRLDWQMWFAALSRDCRSAPWFLKFEERLLEGSPEVLRLLRVNPFPGKPPRYVRARLELYRFTTWASKDWWRKEDAGTFCPPVRL
jgi:hypothetical protein